MICWGCSWARYSSGCRIDQLVGGAVGERDHGDVVERDAADQVQVHHLVNQHRGLAAADLGADDRDRVVGEHRRLLRWIDRGVATVAGGEPGRVVVDRREVVDRRDLGAGRGVARPEAEHLRRAGVRGAATGRDSDRGDQARAAQGDEVTESTPQEASIIYVGVGRATDGIV